MDFLTAKIKQKKELSDLSEDLVKESLENYLKKHKIKIPKSPKQQKIIIKAVRAELRNYVGRFQTTRISYDKKLALLKQKKINDLLKTHSSTKERLDDYPKLIKLIKIKKLKPNSILDLGCGLNPIAISSYFPNAKYYAYDIKEDELKLIKLFFAKNKIDGFTKLKDIRKSADFPKTDLTLVLKTLDIIETKGHTLAKRIMTKLNSKNIIVSFSTTTLSGKPMNSPRRKWFENLLDDLEYKYKIVKMRNEVFYVVGK